MATSTLHIVFNPSAAAGLRDALRQAGRDESVVSLFDCLSFGPINRTDPELRTTWVEEELGYLGWEEVASQDHTFWSQALSSGCRKVAWMSRRSAQDYAGFLEWLGRLGEEPIEVVDLTDVMVTRKIAETAEQKLAICLSLLPPYQILENALLDRTEVLTAARRARYRELWKRLKTEDQPLRVLSEGELVSAPITFFDPLVISCVTSEWKKSARVIGEALGDSFDTSVLQVGDLVLWARARALAEAGRLEFRGDLSDMHNSELRLAGSRAT
jgi:hypothetical protein